ncbi:YslB family protein [Cytobacillus sp. Hz8]|uniref:YslB family protein n=1 Tax=Cytobacillus sp. Hz8 TaxID=3347168 RepID=UPI0035E1D13C
MSEISSAEKISYNDYHVPAFGYELIREILIPELLGKNTPHLLYWAGKSLARKFPLDTFEQIADFFHQAAWGSLETKNENNNEIEFEFTSELISHQLKQKKEMSFQLEAGFLAQQYEMQKKVICEAFEHPRKKGGKVQITIKWDKKDVIE